MSFTSDYSSVHLQYEEYSNDLNEENYERFPAFLFISYSMFLIPGLFVGLPTLVWSVRSLCLQLQDGGRISTFIIFLLFSDTLELFLIPFLVVSYSFPQMLNPSTQPHLQNAFLSVRFWGLYLHQLVALEGILSLRNPLFSSRLSSPLVSIPLSLTLWMCAFTFDFFKLAHILNCVICGLTFVVATILCILTFKAFHSPVSSSYKGRKLALRVLVIAQVTLFVLNGLFMLGFTQFFYFTLWTAAITLMSLRLASDPVLCVLVCRQISREPSDRILH